MEMLAASPMLLVVAALRGELRAVGPAMLAPAPLAAVGYLVVFGSIAGFGSYVWLLRNTTPARASTYAFVNPLIAVVVGALIGHESVGARTLVAAPLIILSVVAVIRPPRTGS
jgi:drug/metabolite transporter (DMT)-like permease